MAMTGGTAVRVAYGTPSGWPGPVEVYVYWKEKSQSIQNNTTTLSLGVYMVTPSGWDIGPWTDWSGSYVGTTTSGTNCKTFSSTIPNFKGTRWLVENQDVTVSHDSDGSKTAIIYWKLGILPNTWSNITTSYGSFSVNLTKIPRAPTITSYPSSFTDETKEITIEYSNPAGAAVTSLVACISLTGSTDDIKYSDHPLAKTGTSYVFKLTEAEFDILRNATHGNSRTVYFFVSALIGDTWLRHNAPTTFTLVNANPLIEPVIVGYPDTNLLVRYHSNATVTINATAIKGATGITKTSVTNGNKTLNDGETFDNVESGLFTITAVDSRGNTTTLPIDLSSEGRFINYSHLTCIISNGRPDANGKFEFEVTGNCFKGNLLNSTPNSVSVKYRYRKKSEEFIDNWSDMTISSWNTTGSYTAIADIDFSADPDAYKNTYEFEVYAKDNLEETIPITKIIKTIPVFDWGENDFNFNVPVYIDGDLTVNGYLKNYTTTVDLRDSKYDTDTYYPVVIEQSILDKHHTAFTYECLHLPRWPDLHDTKWSTHQNGEFACLFRMHATWSGWGWTNNYHWIDINDYRWCDKPPVYVQVPPECSKVVFYLRGGANYELVLPCKSACTIITSETYIGTVNVVAPTTTPANSVYARKYLHECGLLDSVYPVNSIYISYSSTSPAELFGGSWTKLSPYFLYATGDLNDIGGTGSVVTAGGTNSALFIKVAAWRRTA